MPVATRAHIHVDDQGVAWIKGTTTKVIQVAIDRNSQGWSPEEIHSQYPYLSLAQIRAALAYYDDHQEELDAEIERRDQEVERMRAEATGQFTRRELEERLKRRTDATPSD